MVPVGPAGTAWLLSEKRRRGRREEREGRGVRFGKVARSTEGSLSFLHSLSLSRSLCFFLLAGGAQGERRSADEWCNAAPTKTTCKFFSTTATHSHSFGQTLFSILRVTHYTHTTTATSFPPTRSPTAPSYLPRVPPPVAPPLPPRQARTHPNNLDSTFHRLLTAIVARRHLSLPPLPSIAPFHLSL